MLKVGVLMGGMSIEREVSFNSGRTICDHLDTNIYQVIPLFLTEVGKLYILPWTFLYRGKIADFHARLDLQATSVSWDNLKNIIDFMYIAVHGNYGEDGKLQAMLELMDIPYLGSKMFAAALGMNKYLHNQHLASHGILVPKGCMLTPLQIDSYHEPMIATMLTKHGLDFPLIVKPIHEGSSFGVFLVEKIDQLADALRKACYISQDIGQAVLIEEKIEGMEFTCIIITDNHTGKLIALPPTEVLIDHHTNIFDYQKKYMPGAVHERTPAACSPAALEMIQTTSIAAMQALGFSNLARIDGFLTSDNRVIIIDSNPLSGMGPATFLFRQAAEINMSHTQLINHLIETELLQYGIQIEKTFMDNCEKNRLRVGVIFGGPSNEREISLESGRNVIYKLSPQSYQAIPIFMSIDKKLWKADQKALVCHSTQEIAEQLDRLEHIKWSDLASLVDFVFIALHGAPGENGTLQGALEMLRIPYNGSGLFSTALCMDKFKTGQWLAHRGFCVPQAMLVSYDQWITDDPAIEKFIKTIDFPCIVKPHDDGCSVMVKAIKNMHELTQALQDIFTHKKYALIEEKITGMELTVGVIGNDHPQALTPSQTIVKGDLLSLEEKFLPGAGENQTPALLPAEDLALIRKQIVKVYQAAQCKGYARIDCFYELSTKKLTIIEINSLPGLTPATCIFHQAAEDGIRPMEFIDMIIKLGLEEHRPTSIRLVDEALQFHKKENR